MKARKKPDFGMLDVRLLMVAVILLVCIQIGASQSFIEGKNLLQLQKSICGLTTQSRLNDTMGYKSVLTTLSRQTGLPSPAFLPRWSVEKMPFFCRIEHRMAKNSALPLKFRLGSVEYVDWLEGKH